MCGSGGPTSQRYLEFFTDWANKLGGSSEAGTPVFSIHR